MQLDGTCLVAWPWIKYIWKTKTKQQYLFPEIMKWFLEVIHGHVSLLEQFPLFSFYQTNTHQLYHCTTCFWRALTRTPPDQRQIDVKDGRYEWTVQRRLSRRSGTARQCVASLADTLVLSPFLLCCHQQETKSCAVRSPQHFDDSSKETQLLLFCCYLALWAPDITKTKQLTPNQSGWINSTIHLFLRSLKSCVTVQVNVFWISVQDDN